MINYGSLFYLNRFQNNRIPIEFDLNKTKIVVLSKYRGDPVFQV